MPFSFCFFAFFPFAFPPFLSFFSLSLTVSVLATVSILTVLLSTVFGRHFLLTAHRDLKGYLRLRRLQSKMNGKWRENCPIGWHFLQIVRKWPNKKCIVEADNESRTITFSELNLLANKFGNFFASEFSNSVNDHDNCLSVLGIFLDNCIEFVAIWLGMAKFGHPTAWLNTQLKGTTLAHSLRVANCRAVVTSAALVQTIFEVRSLLPVKFQIYCITNGEKGTEIGPNSNSMPIKFINASELADTLEPKNDRQIGFQDTLAYLYTSGTTGPPKAVVIRHHRYFFMGIAGPIVYGITPRDILYIPLPMYHGMAGIAGIGQMVVNGSTVVIRAKFSASNFWSDCVRFDATVAIYIGEICRYLLAQPKSSDEKAHKIRLLCGLGLRENIWEKFQLRFGVKGIGELYGATEGNATVANFTYRTGACGFWPICSVFMSKCSIRLIKVDPISGKYLRDENGICVKCRPGECGEIVGMIRPENPIRRFEGYLDRTETEKKIVKDVEKSGDCAFASGDILKWAKDGFLFFKDRRGDTFRWRGENVSSTQVENVLQDLAQIVDLAVYGVEVPGEEGKAGMVAMALGKGIGREAILDTVADRFHRNLPSFAIPIFLRLCAKMQRTGTFKLVKAELKAEAFCRKRMDGDELYIWEMAEKKYRKMGEEHELIKQYTKKMPKSHLNELDNL